MREAIKALNGHARIAVVVIVSVFAVGLAAGAVVGEATPWHILTRVASVEEAQQQHETDDAAMVQRVGDLEESEAQHYQQLMTEIRSLRSEIRADIRGLRQELRGR